MQSIANAITRNHPEVYSMFSYRRTSVEEVTDMARNVRGAVSSTFDEPRERGNNDTSSCRNGNEKQKRLVEHGRDVAGLL